MAALLDLAPTARPSGDAIVPVAMVRPQAVAKDANAAFIAGGTTLVEGIHNQISQHQVGKCDSPVHASPHVSLSISPGQS